LNAVKTAQRAALSFYGIFTSLVRSFTPALPQSR
jgi:hypothetical protein